MKCNCIEELNEKLKEHGLRVDTVLYFSRDSGNKPAVSPRIALIPLSGKGKSKTIIPSFCPFCGCAVSDEEPEHTEQEAR